MSTQRGLLLAVVFISGMTSLGIEMAASRLLAPYFGTSQFIWANLIGLVLIYLSLGYVIGGRIADRFPRESVHYQITTVAGLFTAIIPLIAHPILSFSLEGFREVSVGIFYGSLIGVILLFAVPVTLLGTVSVFAIRLSMNDVDRAGNTAGAIYALSTIGSILGTFIPVFFLLPVLGTARTIYIAAAVLLGASALGLLRTRAVRTAAVAGLGALLCLALMVVPPGLIKPPPYGKLLAEQESLYNYIQVVEDDRNGDIHLVLNEGHAVHSWYRADPNQPLTGGPWDYWLVAPYFQPNTGMSDVKNMLMLGSAAGTASKLLTHVYGPLPMDNVEIDPAIVEIGHQYFHMDEANVQTHVEDARVYLSRTDKTYSIIGIDAYRQPYIPFHLTTQEFFASAKAHLASNGVLMINAGRTATDFRLVNAIASTMRAVFPHVYIIDVAGAGRAGGNSMIVGTDAADGIANFKANATRISDPILKQVFATSIQYGNMREAAPGELVFTDDKAPVEEVIDQIILNYVSQ
jgi:predicted membrane-bound spermidine synthase